MDSHCYCYYWDYCGYCYYLWLYFFHSGTRWRSCRRAFRRTLQWTFRDTHSSNTRRFSELSPSHAPPPPAPPLRQRAMAQLRPVSVPAVIKDMAGKNLAHTLPEFDRHYMPNGHLDPDVSATGTTLHIVQIWKVKLRELPEVSARFLRSWHMEHHHWINNNQAWIHLYLIASK